MWFSSAFRSQKRAFCHLIDKWVIDKWAIDRRATGRGGPARYGRHLMASGLVPRGLIPRILMLWIAVLSIALTVNPAWAARAKHARPLPSEVAIDFDSGTVLHSVNMDVQRRPASLTKIMTLYLVFAALDAGTLTMDDRLSVSRTASGRSPSKLYLQPGQTISVRNAIKALVTKSANDVATVIAEHLGNGSERRFAKKMTRMARDLGMTRSVFRNASGLHHSRQVSTARDIALLCRRMLLDFPHYYSYFSMRRFSWRGKSYKNHNNLLNQPKVDGIKTGYLRRSGFHIAVSAKRGKSRVIAVVMGGKNSGDRDRRAEYLLQDILDSDKLQKRLAFGTVLSRPPSIIVSDRARLKHGNGQSGAGIGVADKGTIAQSQNAQPKNDQIRINSGQWRIQVGAFHRRERAYLAAEKSMESVTDHLDRAFDRPTHIQIIPRQKRKRRLYLARLTGFVGRKDAYMACRVLKKAGMDCLPIAPS